MKKFVLPEFIKKYGCNIVEIIAVIGVLLAFMQVVLQKQQFLFEQQQVLLEQQRVPKLHQYRFWSHPNCIDWLMDCCVSRDLSRFVARTCSLPFRQYWRT